MKKRDVLLACFMMVFLGMNAFAQSSKKIELTFFETLTSPARTEYLQKMFAKFEEKNPNITVKLISPPYEQAENKLTQMLNAKQPLDIIESRDATVRQFVNNGQIVSLEKYISSWKYTSDLLPVTIQSMRSIDNTAYILPWLYFVKALYVRTDILKSAGLSVPKTIEELYQEAVKLTNPSANKYGYVIRGKHNAWKVSQDYMCLSDVPNLDANKFYWTKDGKFAYKTPEGKAALERYLDLYKKATPKDGINWGFAEQINAFVSGLGVFLIQDPDAMGMIDEQLGADKYGIYPVPVGKTGKAYQDYAFQGLSLVSYSPNKDAAWKLMSFLLEPETNAEFCKTYGALPVHKSTFANNKYFSSGKFSAWNTMLQDPETWVMAKYPISDARFPAWGSYQEQVMQSFMLGQITSDEAIDRWAKYWE